MSAAGVEVAPRGGTSAVDGWARIGSTSLAARLTLLAVGVFLVALTPRLIALDLFPTSDEDSWMRRTGGFTFGLVNGQLGRTYQNGHPGVTTMWIGMLSQGTDGALRFADRVHGLRYVAQVPGYLDGLAQARVGFAVLGALGVAGSALLVWRLFGAGPAVLAGAALATEPFLVANQQLVHVDGPLVTFTTLAMLAMLVRWTAGGGAWFVVLAGLSTGLALLSKTPALFLVGFAPLVAVGSTLLKAGEGRGVRGLTVDLLVWSIVAVATFALLWPAIWVLGPVEVLSRIVAFTRETGGQPDEVGSFFLGQAGADPGPFYYPVSTLFRLSPFATLGLALVAALVWRAPAETRARAGWLLLFALGFGLMMTVGAKKFDRYLLPSVPALVIVASVGWWLLLQHVRRASVLAAAGVALAALLIYPLASTYPYPLSYYNPLLGGGAVAQRAVMVGNGEGLDQAAKWLAAQPNASELRVSAHSWDILAGLVAVDGEPLREGVPDDADYIVTYGRRIQMHRWGTSLERFLAANPPVYTVWINGIEYVHIHPGPRRGRTP
ncbi:MAG: glycosyltransferase family 39 protein [Chloroflexota bacterium]